MGEVCTASHETVDHEIAEKQQITTEKYTPALSKAALQVADGLIAVTIACTNAKNPKPKITLPHSHPHPQPVVTKA